MTLYVTKNLSSKDRVSSILRNQVNHLGSLEFQVVICGMRHGENSASGPHRKLVIGCLEIGTGVSLDFPRLYYTQLGGIILV